MQNTFLKIASESVIHSDMCTVNSKSLNMLTEICPGCYWTVLRSLHSLCPNKTETVILVQATP